MTTTKTQDLLSRQSNDPFPDMEVEKFMHLHKAFLYSTVAMTCLIIYDYVITFDMEVEYIWKSKIKISLTNFLFFLNRYFPIVRAVTFLVFSFRPPHSPRSCQYGTDFNSWSTMLNVATVEILMLTRTWALWGGSRAVGFILLGFFLIACVACGFVIQITIKSIPGVIPLPPVMLLPCDRPSPYKYMITYSIGLALELISFGFMMGRIAYLENRTVVGPRNSRRLQGAMVPLIKALALHGTYYFFVVIFTMTFSLLSAFVEKLARAVINAGISPTLTSIACNRVIFALHGTYLSIREPNAGDTSRPQVNDGTSRGWWRRRSEQQSRADTPYISGIRRTRDEQTTYEDAYHIAHTRNELLTKDLGNVADYANLLSADGQSKMDTDVDTLAQGKQVQSDGLLSPGSNITKTPTTPNSNVVANVSLMELRSPKLRPPFHGHNPSSSTVLTSDESANHTLAHVPSLERDGAVSKSATAWTHGTSKSVSRSLRRPGSASSSQGRGAVGFVGPDGSPLAVKRSSSFGKPSFSVRARVMTPNRAPIVAKRESGNGEQEVEIPSPPVDATDSTWVEPSSPKSFGDKIGSLLWKRKGSLREHSGPHSPSSGSFAFNATTGRRPSVGVGEGNPLSVINPPLKTTGSRMKERHPLDHHYEMDTIHSTADNMMDGGWAASTFDETGNVDEDGIVVLDEWSRGDEGDSERASPGLSHHSPPSDRQGLSRNI
ncbi:hypothetical protein CPB86DRAFT_799902 [Serendipita vermifera]|nr:hypothetical protein CPB86DRAFT_799902 [Serendipita vermifera]